VEEKGTRKDICPDNHPIEYKSKKELEDGWRQISVKEAKPKWLRKSYVGTIQDYKRLDALKKKKNFFLTGLGFILICYLGDNYVLLTGVKIWICQR